MSERLERVERFEELRAGMVVVVTPCAYCGGRHRSMLIGPYRWPDGDVGFEKLGDPCNMRGAKHPPTVWRDEPGSSLRGGRLFRVLDGLEEPSTETAAASGTTRRTPQKERAR